ncbi:glycosyltransferase [Pontibacter qinzhouensis]|uniref:Glycosyltransferase n=1 Tax=Pontibacter qinzhouensis TaxID=2603253 RepID=A0A5C8IQF8_9BACT|nr:glycosyltransferase [Pontibacter qinzhouensis]TXK23266.1 glycosyltransferase [Pontibacter qinzhouensis]
MSYLLFLSLAVYGYFIVRRWHAWQKMPVTHIPVGYLPATAVSVIVPARNEEGPIRLLLQDLEQQRYPKELLEVLVVDDHSEDGTAKVVSEYRSKGQMNVRLIQLASYTGLAQKKAAVQKGIELAMGKLLVFTDGDCRVQPGWVAHFEYIYTSQQPKFISGPVSFYNTNSLFERMQLVEFASLIGIGAASIQLNRPNMCNGANLAYTREVFEQVGGFSGNEQVASGDDEFLLHKINRHFPGNVAFLKNEQALVYTEARKNLKSFISQRVRWASKWKSYQEWHVQMLALSVFLVNFLLLLAVPFALGGYMSIWVLVGAYAIKFGIDFLFLKRILSFLNRKSYLVYMLPLQMVYTPYVIYTAIKGLTGRYSWKGRLIRNP